LLVWIADKCEVVDGGEVVCLRESLDCSRVAERRTDRADRATGRPERAMVANWSRWNARLSTS
jgi:hypothetical protein